MDNTREKLIELLESAFERFIDDPYCIPDEREFADHMIANGVTIQKWIPVTERLPDKDGRYIVTACDEGCSCGDGIWYDTVVIEAEHYKGEWSWNENGTEYDITDFVTHWQPMPQPPKGE